MMVLGDMAASNLVGSARKVTGSTGILMSLIRSMSQALSMAACAESAQMILGSVIAFSSSAHWRCVFVAMITDSVPPEVTVPHTPSSPPLTRLAVIAMISDSNLFTEGQTSVCNGFETLKSAKASSWTFRCSGSPDETGA